MDRIAKAGLFTLIFWLPSFLPAPTLQEEPEAAVYTVSFPSQEEHLARIEASLPTGGEDTVQVMMPVWSPGLLPCGRPCGPGTRPGGPDP